MFYQNGQSRPQTKKGAKLAIATLVVMGASIAIPVLGAGSANAASIDAWDKIAQCESSGLWNRPDGDGGRSSGGLQFQPASWNDALAYLRSKGVDTSGYPQGSGHQAYKATKKQQIIAGEALLALQGPSAWACNRLVGFPLQSTGPNSSMFKGGVNPYAGDTTPTPTPPKPTPPSTPDSPPVKGDEKYTVQKGDHLSKIATLKKVEGGWKVLYDANVKVIGSNPNLILPGQVLTIPRPVVKHTVKAGDHLTALAAKYHVDGGWKTIYEANKDVIGSNPNVIEIGMVLVIPNGSAPSAPTTPTTPKPPVTPPASTGWVLPIAKGSYIRGDGLINSGGCMSRSCGGHSGLDLSARQGTVVRAIGGGTVMHAGYGYAGAAYGNHVVIKHSDGRYTLYGHLSASVVRAGQTVSAGQMIGNVGSTGNSSGPHLHFEVRTNPNQFAAGIFLNPVTYLASKGLSL